MERIFYGKGDKFMYIVDEYSDLVTRICYLRLVVSDIKPAEYELIEYIRELPKHYGIVLYLYYYEGYKIKEISVLINKNENTVKTMMRKAKILMKEVLENEGF